MFDLERRSQLLIGLVLAILVFAGGIAYAKHFLQPAPAVVVNPAPAAETEREPEKTLFVHVSGAVDKPGIYQLPAGARVYLALEKAGVDKEADTQQLNLAAPLADGQKLHVPRVGEIIPNPTTTPATAGNKTGGRSGSSTSGNSFAAAPNSAAPVNLNSADVAELDARLPGIGPALAQRIVDYRQQHGAFRRIEDIQNVSGIGPKKFAQIKDLIAVY